MGKLDDIKFNKKEVYKHVSSNGSVIPVLLNITTPGLLYNTYNFSYNLYRNIDGAYQQEPNKLAWAFSVPGRMRNQAACDYTGDTGTLILAFEHLEDYPEAQKMLWHYLSGNGHELEVDTARVIKDDAKVKAKVWSVIAVKIGEGKKSGSINIQQRDYSNENWRNAFGSINVKWIMRVNNRIDLWIEDRYKWHPHEARTTQCVHQAMERAQKYGAKEFDYKGSVYTISISDLKEQLRQNIQSTPLP